MTLLAAMEAYCRQHGMSEAQLGRQAAGSATFMHRLRRGVQPTDAVKRLVKRFLGEHKDGPPLAATAGGGNWLAEMMTRRIPRY